MRAVCLEGKLEFTFFFQAYNDIVFGRCAVAFLGKMLNKPLIYEIEIKVKDHTPTMKRLKCLNDNSHKGRSLTSYGWQRSKGSHQVHTNNSLQKLRLDLYCSCLGHYKYLIVNYYMAGVLFLLLYMHLLYVRQVWDVFIQGRIETLPVASCYMLECNF